MKLYYSPASCGAASFIAASIGKVPVETEAVDLATHKTKSGADFYTVNVKGNVPTLVLDCGTVLNEGAATLQYLADKAAPGSGLAPAWGTTERYVMIGNLNYVASEVHPSYGPFFNPALTAEQKEAATAKLHTKLAFLEANVVGKSAAGPFLQGADLDVASIYLYIVLGWSQYIGISLAAYPKLVAFHAAAAAHAGVVAAHAKMNA